MYDFLSYSKTLKKKKYVLNVCEFHECSCATIKERQSPAGLSVFMREITERGQNTWRQRERERERERLLRWLGSSVTCAQCLVNKCCTFSFHVGLIQFDGDLSVVRREKWRLLAHTLMCCFTRLGSGNGKAFLSKCCACPGYCMHVNESYRVGVDMHVAVGL